MTEATPLEKLRAACADAAENARYDADPRTHVASLGAALRDAIDAGLIVAPAAAPADTTGTA